MGAPPVAHLAACLLFPLPTMSLRNPWKNTWTPWKRWNLWWAISENAAPLFKCNENNVVSAFFFIRVVKVREEEKGPMEYVSLVTSSITSSPISPLCFSTAQAICLADQPKPVKEYKYPEKLPGELYDANTQCKWQFGEKAKVCMLDFKKASDGWHTFNALCCLKWF